MMRFEKGRQREDENIDKFLDDLQLLRRHSQPDESNRRMNLAITSKLNDGVRNDELKTMLATHYTPLLTNAPIPEEDRLNFKEYLLLKPPMRSNYFRNKNSNYDNGPANQVNNWYKLRDDKNKTRLCANCSSTDYHVSAFSTYKQGKKQLASASKMKMRRNRKICSRVFLLNLEGHFKSDCLRFWDAVADIKHPRQEEVLSW